MNDSNRPATMSATAAAAAIRQGRLTSLELVSGCLQRISEREDAVAAWAHLDQDYALQQASAADAAVASGKPLGALHGVPVGVKDIIDTSDFPTENGTPAFAGRRPQTDAAVVTALRAAGAVILGKTVTTELAFFGPGKTRNPHDPERTPGGSSSGSAAAVADGQVPLALGTQTAGSILRPASYCGCIGFKPTFGLVPREGVLAQSAPLDTIGGYARSIDDLALLIDILSGDTRQPVTKAVAAAGTQSRSLRLAFVRTASWPMGEPAMLAAVSEYAVSIGATEIALPDSFTRGITDQQAVQFRDIARNYGPILDTNRGVMSTKLAEVVALGRAVTDAQYDASLARRQPLYEEFGVLFRDFDAVLTPAAPGIAPVGLGATGSPAFNALWTYLGVPAISLPLLTVDNMPLGIQAVALRDRDSELLSAAAGLLQSA
ncbi:MAG: amidase [Hyphomicrobiaceae bacterium]|nr:amidase [Hyphomicrobiaceae bacterium]